MTPTAIADVGPALVRWADDVVVSVGQDAGTIERAGLDPLVLPNEARRLAVLGRLLHTPRPLGWLRTTLARECPAASGGDLVTRLLTEGVLVSFDLPMQLAELHLRTTAASRWPAASPAVETARILRESSSAAGFELPPPAVANIALGEALASRRTLHEFGSGAIALADLASLLGNAIGQGRGTCPFPLPLVAGAPAPGRAYPSGGALYPIELLVYPLHVASVAPGFYAYQFPSHRLVPRAPATTPAALVSLLNNHPVEAACVLLLLWADLARPTFGKYGRKVYRLMLLEAGHIAQNVLLVGSALGLGGLPLCGFKDKELSRAAGLAFPQEVIVYVLALGVPPGPEGG